MKFLCNRTQNVSKDEISAEIKTLDIQNSCFPFVLFRMICSIIIIKSIHKTISIMSLSAFEY